MLQSVSESGRFSELGLYQQGKLDSTRLLEGDRSERRSSKQVHNKHFTVPVSAYNSSLGRLDASLSPVNNSY